MGPTQKFILCGLGETKNECKSKFYMYIYPWWVYLVDYEELVMSGEELQLAERNCIWLWRHKQLFGHKDRDFYLGGCLSIGWWRFRWDRRWIVFLWCWCCCWLSSRRWWSFYRWCRRWYWLKYPFRWANKLKVLITKLIAIIWGK